MRAYLEHKAGQTVRLIIEMNPQKQPTHFYEGPIIRVGEDSVIIKDQHLGDIAINPQKITAVQIIQAT